MSGGQRRERTVGLVSLAVLGSGFVAMAAGVDNFWMAWVLGFAVVVPAVSMYLEDDDVDEDDETDASEDPLETLRERYARGELTDEEFERRLERLLETEGVGDGERTGEDLGSAGLGELDAQVETDRERER